MTTHARAKSLASPIAASPNRIADNARVRHDSRVRMKSRDVSAVSVNVDADKSISSHHGIFALMRFHARRYIASQCRAIPAF